MQPRLLGSGTSPRSLCAFLSFATKDAALVEVFRNRIGKQYPGVELLDHAVKDGYEEDWQEECARKIDRSEWLICLIGHTTHRSRAVAWEIDRGLSLGKRIVAVNLSAHAGPVPQILARNAIEPQQGIGGIALSAPAAPERGANGRAE
ncbi:MAG: TIR domain-containing protein [Gammaproteobacteria bacterium]|nr:TIR domain-containing protein [Gammaproteobacteria bacterium]